MPIDNIANDYLMYSVMVAGYFIITSTAGVLDYCWSNSMYKKLNQTNKQELEKPKLLNSLGYWGFQSMIDLVKKKCNCPHDKYADTLWKQNFSKK